MTTLVTGATGFIGSHLAHQLLDDGQAVRVLVRSPRKLDEVGLGGREGLDVAVGDLLDPASIERALEGVDRIYHVAGYISTARKDRERLHRLNHDITVNLFEAARKRPVEKVVYLASIFALGGGGPRPVREDVAYDLDGFGIDYFEAKRRAELYAYECRDAGMPLVLVYPCFCYGPGDVYNSSSKLIEMHLARRLVVSFPGGQNAMDVRDAARGLILGMERGRIGQKYLVGGRNCTYQELGEILAGVTGLSRPRLRVGRRVVEWTGKLAEKILSEPPIDAQSAKMATRYWYYDDSKARRELGYRSRPLEDTMRDAVQWFVDTGRASL